MSVKRHKLSKIVRLHRQMIRAQKAAIKAWKVYSKYYVEHPDEHAKVHNDI